MSWSRLWSVAIAILSAGACSTRMPELPRLEIARFRPQVRGEVQRAFDEARQRRNDPEASGRLGMLLYAFEQYQSAEACYRRARFLAPGSFQWAYYLGLAESLDGKAGDATSSLGQAVLP
jgi:hypothetical protein